MKKWIVAALCLMLAGSFAAAEETVREREIILEGMSEIVTEALYQSDAGFEMWYPTEYLAPGEKYGHDCMYPVGADEQSDIYFMIVSAEADPADAEALIEEAVGGFEPEAVGETEWTTTESGVLLGSVCAEAEGIMYAHYLAADEERVLLITAAFPVEAAEGFGVRFDRMAETIAFTGHELSGRHEGEGYALAYPEDHLIFSEVMAQDGFVPREGGAESGVYMIILGSDIDPGQGDAFLEEAVGGYEGEFTVTRGEEQMLASGLKMNWIQAEQGGRIDRYYLIRDEETVYCLTASFPALGETDYGFLFDAMAESFEFVVKE